MDMKVGIASAEEDLELERKLAKKLKVKKGGKLRGVDDGINILFDGISSALDSLEDNEIPDDEEDYKNIKSSKRSAVSKKGKKRKLSDASDQGLEEVLSSNTAVEQVDSTLAEATHEEPSVKAPALDGKRKYVPPQQRSLVRNESDEYTQFRRSVKGLLNKLSESNLESITKEMSTIFRMASRSVASQIISEEILGFCSQGPRGNEQFAAVFAAFVAGMACSVGMDFSAKLLASLAKLFEDEYQKGDNLSLRNLTLLLSYLCIFGVCASDLIYDFLILLGKRLMEVDVSTILTILQCCGMKLRGDDPAGMKNFILSVQNRVNELKSSSMVDGHPKIDNKRMEFMLETICDIKNNKKRSKEDPASHTWIKKWLQKLKVEDILLRGLKWSKLLDPCKKGQWWLSGEMTSSRDNVEEVANIIDREVLEAQKFMQLAAAQRMNTDARRAIFSVIMSAEDYVDAFEKLLRLDLPGKQDREIMRVIIECCLQEKVFNKYYTILASKLCSHDKNHKFTLQYCLWDQFKELESKELIRSMNLARFVAEMLSSFSLSLSVLKVVKLSNPNQLTPKRIMHFRMLFGAIFEYSDAMVWNVFTRIALTPELESLRNDIEFFIKQYLVNTDNTLSTKFKIARKALNNVDGVLM
ncbi:nucleolar MIF4G domain-containing protein 1 isoform X2 [Telopea speciosissima]|nr:nucleolar MIF4G domain-containing protein 1 isoform X2 [Telopea speciosissima]